MLGVASILILELMCGIGIQTVSHKAGHSATAEIPEVTLCELMAHPNDYSGRQVKVTATLASGEEFSIFTDDACHPINQKNTVVLATFSEGKYKLGTPMGKRLWRVLDKNHQAEVVVVGRFEDPGRLVGHQNCCRYKLEVERLLDVRKPKPGTPATTQ